MKAIRRIELLGGLWVQHADRVIVRFPTQKTAVLLAYLAYYHQHPHPRDALIDQFRPEIDLDAARSSLRSALYSLRQLLEHEDGAAARGPAPAAVRSAATAPGARPPSPTAARSNALLPASAS